MGFILTSAVALFLSFLSLGILWTGVSQWVQFVPALLYLVLSYVAAKKMRNANRAISACVLGATPLGAVLTLFRDKNDSHALGIAIAVGWLMGILVGGAIAKWRSHLHH